MHPIMGYEVAKARIADLQRQAESDRMARAARAARKDGSRLFVPGHWTMALARRVLAVLGRSSRPPVPAPPAQAPKTTP